MSKKNSHDPTRYHKNHVIAAPLSTKGGATVEVNAGLGLKRPACFGSSVEAFQAYSRTLISRGFIRVGQREFIDPSDGRVLVLTKPSRFGTRLKSGKNRNTARRFGIIVG